MATIISAVEVKGFVLRQTVIVPPANGRPQSKHEAITSFLTEDASELMGLMAIYWAGDVDERIVEALPSGDVYAVPGIRIETKSFTGPDGGSAAHLLAAEHKKLLGLA